MAEKEKERSVCVRERNAKVTLNTDDHTNMHPVT